MDERTFDELWRQYTVSRFDLPEEKEQQCIYAQLFQQWTSEELLGRYVGTEPSVLRLAEAKVHLIDRFFDWRVSVPKLHRNRVGENGHSCIFHVFERTYQQIRLLELTLKPALLVVPPPAVPRPAQIEGVTLGEVLGEEA